jgi:hypothetical protein
MKCGWLNDLNNMTDSFLTLSFCTHYSEYIIFCIPRSRRGIISVFANPEERHLSSPLTACSIDGRPSMTCLLFDIKMACKPGFRRHFGAIRHGFQELGGSGIWI